MPAKKVAKRASAKKVSKPANTGPTYTATLTVFGKQYVGKGPSVAEAIGAISLKNPPKVRGVLNVSNGTDSRDRILMPVAVQRLFSTAQYVRAVQIKNVSLLFGA